MVVTTNAMSSRQLMMRVRQSIVLLLSILLFALPSTPQRISSARIGDTHFYLDEPFKRPARIPKEVVRLLLEEIEKGQLCGREEISRGTEIESWFSASKINLNNHRHALILKSGKECLTGVDNDWFWIFLKTRRGYRLVLTGSTIIVDVLRTGTHDLRDIETSVATANTNYSNIYGFNGLVYRARRCREASPVESRPKSVPCRHLMTGRVPNNPMHRHAQQRPDRAFS